MLVKYKHCAVGCIYRLLMKATVIKKLIASIIMVSLMAMPFTSLASTIRYEGGAENFVIVPGTEYSETDLFNNFKNVMPGDELKQSITIKNNSKKSDYIKIYLKAEPHGEENPLSKVVDSRETVDSMNDFLSQLKLYVWNGDEVPYMNSPDNTGNLTNYQVLGRLEYGKSMDLDLVLKVPIEMDNEYMNRIGEVDWIFMVEHLNYDKGGGGSSGGGGGTDHKSTTDVLPVETSSGIDSSKYTIDETSNYTDEHIGPNNEYTDNNPILKTNPDTSDNRAVGAYVIMLGIGCLSLIATLFKKDNKKNKKI